MTMPDTPVPDTPVPDAAVRIAAEEFDAYHYDNVENAKHVVAALARDGYLHDPAEVAALRAELDKVKGYQAELSERCYRKDLELDELRSRGTAAEH